MQGKITTVQQHILDEERMHPGATGDFTGLLTSLTLAAKIISREVNKAGLVKILGRGEITRPLTVRAHAFSDRAKRAIETAGGRVEIIPAPWGDGRPPARGNALSNR